MSEFLNRFRNIVPILAVVFYLSACNSGGESSSDSSISEPNDNSEQVTPTEADNPEADNPEANDPEANDPEADDPEADDPTDEFDPTITASNVAEADSPVEGVSGIKRPLNDSSTIFLLNNDEPGMLEIKGDPEFTDGDMSTAIGGAFFEFVTTDDTPAKVVLETDEDIKSIFECSLTESLCDAVAVEILSTKSISFQSRPGWHYVFLRNLP